MSEKPAVTEKAVLFVDDEKSILRSLKRALLDSDYRLYFADSAASAMAALEARRIDIVVSDMRMPEMDGYRFLNLVKQRYPDVIRLILSGYTCEDTAYKAIIDGTAKMYIPKPWDNTRLKELLARLLEIEDVLRDHRLLELINGISELPILPDIYRRIMELIETDAAFDDIIAVVERDPGIAAKVLQVANSSYFRVATASLKRAAVYIGLMNLKDIVLSSSVFTALTCPEAGNYSPKSIWEHSVCCNGLLHELHERVHERKIDETRATAGLLHDIGMLLLLQQFPAEYGRILVRCDREGGRGLVAMEREVFGVDHAQLGAWLLNWWNMPLPIIAATLYHHHPPAGGNPDDAAFLTLVHIADLLAMSAFARSWPGDPDPEIIARAGISGEIMQEYRERCFFINSPSPVP
ncbi:MAG: HDOD domain-containing protein [Deltaproteobacteria bacterium]|nr:HDOD domain-containing protein [Candidatus Anaeroferrophillacea bacterium]